MFIFVQVLTEEIQRAGNQVVSDIILGTVIVGEMGMKRRMQFGDNNESFSQYEEYKSGPDRHTIAKAK